MAIGINVVKEDLERLMVRITLTGLATDGTRYDVMRLQHRYLGKDQAGVRRYERQVPDARVLWSSVAHRVGWEPPSATVTFRDYEAPRRPVKYFLVESDKVGPSEYTDWGDAKYPLSRGVIDDEIVHFNGDLADADLDAEPDPGHVLVRSTADLSLFAEACLVEMDGPTYTARGTEHAVMGSQFPIFVTDSREARRGSLTLMTRNLGEYSDLKRIVFPESGRIRPVIFNSGPDPSLLLDDMRVVPLTVELEQVSNVNADWRYLRIDYIEIDPSAPLIKRSGDNDDLVDPPVASFTVSPANPKPGQWTTLRSTSTGQFDEAEWTLGHATFDNKMFKYYTEGPIHTAHWPNPGIKQVKLRVWGSGAGASTCTKRFRVG